ncbi:cation:proton antiporter [Ehrlichia ruminantium]|uniref:Cation:proton antiporter n=1 Tax=Ehrlichia ruminantium TaxID=779 RepID=A0AAE6Q9F7_EHRRU|nr:proton-conducting transporter membrane subunit [Ehrlichia ruminantium]QGR02726.1 cation:proton antiporter [Ehrlichia ruminantium]QGR03646.1 cation:proton antiporter [Ehrlichia ruminantium]QGR04573.1 cation:proton antiporter [Ehrlichia ruminantium]
MHFFKNLASDFLITWPVLLPYMCAVLVLLLKKFKYSQETLSIIFSCALFYTVFNIYTKITADKPVLYTVLCEFTPKIQLILKTEPIGIIFSLLASFLWTVTTIYTISYMTHNDKGNKKQPIFYACFAASIGCTMGIAFSGNLLTLFIFYELLTISTYPLVTYYTNHESQISGRHYIGILLGTSMLLFLPAIIITYNVSGTLDFTNGGILPSSISNLFLFTLLSVFIYSIGKTALMPIHSWLPKAMVAPTPVSALLHAVAVVKSGIFALIKILLYVIGLEKLQALFQTHHNILMYVSEITIILASFIAIKQTNLKKVLAYSTISQLSYIIMTVSLYTEYAIDISIFQMISHAFAKITLFFTAGAIYTKTGKKYLHELQGIGKSMPITMITFSIGAIAMIGIPPASTFWGKFFIISESFSQDILSVVLVLVLSTILNTIYFVPIIYNAFYATCNAKYNEAPVPMLVATTVTTICTIILFLYPDIVFNIINHIK